MKTFGMMAAVAVLAIGLAMPAAAIDADKFTGSAPVLVKEREQNPSANRQGNQQARQNRGNNQDPEVQAWQEEIKKLRQELKQLAQKYRNASESERAAIKSEMRTKLERIFDLQSQIMQKRIDKLAERLEQLRAKKTERDSNRATLIDERLEKLTNRTPGDSGGRRNRNNSND